MTPTTASWLWLLGGICLEACGTICLKLSQGFTRPLPSVMLFVFYAASFTCVTLAVKRIELGMAYAIWSGVGTLFITTAGIVWFDESASLVKLAFIGLIVTGVVGLKWFAGQS
ncbi:MAG: multidrug efflux SMR transporter [bacterium]